MATILLIVIYIVFISLGLPDGIFGGAWPAIYPSINTTAGVGGLVSLVVTAMTIVSSLATAWLSKRLGVGLLLTISTALTVAGLIGYSQSASIYWLILFSVPLGFGAGAIDSALNNYVASHYKAHHMNWLHACWGIGATIGPVIYTFALANTDNWRNGYLAVGLAQGLIVLVLLLALPLWARIRAQGKHIDEHTDVGNVKFAILLQEKKAILAFISFLLYVGVEVAIGIWLGTYLVKIQNVSLEQAALWSALYYASITVGRIMSGFIVMKVSNRQLIRYGIVISLAGAIIILMNIAPITTLFGIALIGIGFAPVYPGMIHETPHRFGKLKSAKVMSLQMVGGYVGATIIPSLIGILSGSWSFNIVMYVILFAITLMLVTTEFTNKIIR